jgi:hypothetical protein
MPEASLCTAGQHQESRPGFSKPKAAAGQVQGPLIVTQAAAALTSPSCETLSSVPCTSSCCKHTNTQEVEYRFHKQTLLLDGLGLPGQHAPAAGAGATNAVEETGKGSRTRVVSVSQHRTSLLLYTAAPATPGTPGRRSPPAAWVLAGMGTSADSAAACASRQEPPWSGEASLGWPTPGAAAAAAWVPASCAFSDFQGR